MDHATLLCVIFVLALVGLILLTPSEKPGRRPLAHHRPASAWETWLPMLTLIPYVPLLAVWAFCTWLTSPRKPRG